MMMNYRLLKVSSPLFASTVTLLMPIVAIIWGILDGEKLSIAVCWCSNHYCRIDLFKNKA
jgi:hypothetical protein